MRRRVTPSIVVVLLTAPAAWVALYKGTVVSKSP